MLLVILILYASLKLILILELSRLEMSLSEEEINEVKSVSASK
jgi:hypothetical protein